RRPQQQHIAVLFDEAEGAQLGDQLAVQRRLEVEVELRQRLVDRVGREPQPPALAARFGLAHLQLQELLENLRGGALLSERLIERGAELLGGGREAELSQVLS